jgi:PAS domain S-box-containing protein
MFRLREQDSESILPRLAAFRDFAEALESAVVLVTPERRIVYMNRAARQMWGSNEGRLCYQTLRNSRKACSDCTLGGVVETCTVSRKELRMSTADGWHTYEWIYIPLRGPNSRPQLVALMCTNIDYQKHLEKEVVREKGLSAAILSAQSTFVIGFEENGRVEFVNRAWEGVSGYSEEEMTDGGGFRMLVPKEHRGEVDDYLSSMSRGVRPAKRLVVPLLTKGGEEKVFSWTYSLISGEGAGAEKAVMIGQDVTEREKALMEVERWSRELEIVNEILKKAGTSVAVEEMLDAALSVLVELPGYRCGAAYLLGGEGESARRLAMLGFAKGELPRSLSRVERVFPATAVYNSKVEFAWPGTKMHPMVQETLDREGLQGFVAVPLVPGGHPAGILLLGHDLEAERAEEDRSIMEAAAEAFELGAENLYFRARAEENAREASALYRVASSVTEEKPLDRTLERIVQEASALLGVDICSIFLYDGDTGLLSGKAGVGADVMSIAVPLSESGTGSEAARTLEPVLAEDAERDSRVPSFVTEEYGVKSSLAMPLIVEGSFAGAIFFDMKRKRKYSERELSLVESLAKQAAQAIYNASLLDGLRKSEERYRLVVESTEDIVFTTDAEARLTFMNERVRSVLGRGPVEHLGFDYLQYVDEADRGYLEAMINTISSGGTIRETRVPLRSKDGTEVLLSLKANPIMVDGMVTGAVGVARDVTEQVKAEEALRESEEQYRALADNSFFGVLLHDGKEILYLNKRAEEISGYSREEIASTQDVLDMLVPEEQGAIDRGAARQIAGEETPRVYEARLKRKDGSIAVIQLQNARLTLSGNNATMVTFSDVTDRVKAEEAVLASEERYRVLVETSPNAVFIANLHGEILFANRKSSDLAGMPPEELIGKNIDDFLAPEEAEKVGQEFKAARQAGRGMAKRLTRVIAGGAEKYFEASASVIDEPGQETRVMVIANDVTERELAQRWLRESEERYRAIVEASRDVILMINRGGEILYVNPEAERSFKYKTDEAIGRHIYGFLHPDDRERAAEAIANTFRRGTANQNFPATILAGDGSPLYVEVNSGLVGWPDEDAVEILVIRNVTERRKREQEQELRLRAEEVLVDIATRFVNPDDIYAAIGVSLERTGRLLGVSRAHYFEFSGDGETMSCDVEWVAEGDEPTKDRLQGLRIADYPWWIETLSAGRTVVRSDIEEIPEAAVREVLRGQNVLAVAVAPIFKGERLAGFMSYHDVKRHREWSLPEEEALREVAETISHALERKEWIEELERSESFRARITEGIDEGLMVLGNGVVTWVNRRAYEMLGYGPEELIGQSTENLFPSPKHEESLALGAAKALMSGERYIREEKAKRKDGSLIDIMVTVGSLGVLEEDSVEIVATITDITESKRMRERVEAAADTYSTIFSLASDGLVVTTLDGDIKDVNEKICAYTGLSREELLSQNIADLVPQKVRHLFGERRDEVLRDGYTVFETKLVRKDGGTLPVEVSSQLATVWGEDVILSALHDITERKMAEVETERRSVQLASLNEILKAATRSLELDLASKDVLATSMEESGAESGVLILERHPDTGTFDVMASEGFTPEHLSKLDTDALKRELAELASGPGGAAVFDIPLGAADKKRGGIVDLFKEERIRSALLVPLKKEERVTGVLCLASKSRRLFREQYRDFYNAAGAEIRVALQNAIIYRELAAEHERLALLYRSAQDISEQTGLDALLDTVAREAAGAIGAESALLAFIEPGRDEFVWRAAYNLDLGLLEGIHVPLDKGLGGEVIGSKRAASTEARERIPGEVTWEDPLADIFRGKQGIGVPLVAGDKVLGVLTLQCSIELRVSDEDVRMLEAMGRHAGVGIENLMLYEETKHHLQALEVAHQELMELDRMKSDFVSTVSHELRSPLAVIEGFARTLVENFERIDRDTERESLEIILKKSTVLEGLIANILDLSRIEAGRLEVNFEVLDLAELCRRVMGDQERLAEVHRLKLVAPDREVEVVADLDKAEVVLANLVRNAIKFSPKGGTVTVAVRETGEVAEVSVTDEGVGIAPEEQDKIFDRFYQVESGAARSFPGTGLGLYITSELLHAMGGTIRVDSEPGAGSTFTFTLPLAGIAGVAEGPA